MAGASGGMLFLLVAGRYSLEGDTLGMLAGTHYGQFADAILDNGWVRPNKRIFNNAKVSDHFAIIPTNEQPKKLTEAEQKIYDMVTKRFLAVFYPAAEFLETTRITRVLAFVEAEAHRQGALHRAAGGDAGRGRGA